MDDETMNAIMDRVDRDLDGLDATSDGDRLWFEENPDRNFRLRDSTQHEKWTGTHPDEVLVCQLQEGARIRVPVMAKKLGRLDLVTEVGCLAVFEWLSDLMIKMGGERGRMMKRVRREMSKKVPHDDWVLVRQQRKFAEMQQTKSEARN